MLIDRLTRNNESTGGIGLRGLRWYIIAILLALGISVSACEARSDVTPTSVPIQSTPTTAPAPERSTFTITSESLIDQGTPIPEAESSIGIVPFPGGVLRVVYPDGEEEEFFIPWDSRIGPACLVVNGAGKVLDMSTKYGVGGCDPTMDNEGLQQIRQVLEKARENRAHVFIDIH